MLLLVSSGTGGLLLRTVHVLQSLDSTHHGMNLLVPSVLYKLLKEHINDGEPSAILVDNHLQCWGYDNQHDNGNSGGEYFYTLRVLWYISTLRVLWYISTLRVL